MSDDNQKRIFANNLNRQLALNNKTQKEVAEVIGVSPQTFNTWCQGIAIPRMGKIQKLADYFHISKLSLIDEQSEAQVKVDGEGYYLDPETAKVAQELFDDPDLRVLFDAARDSKPEHLQLAADILRKFKETNPDG